jgi:hypothetical protein
MQNKLAESLCAIGNSLQLSCLFARFFLWAEAIEIQAKCKNKIYKIVMSVSVKPPSKENRSKGTI